MPSLQNIRHLPSPNKSSITKTHKPSHHPASPFPHPHHASLLRCAFIHAHWLPTPQPPLGLIQQICNAYADPPKTPHSPASRQHTSPSGHPARPALPNSRQPPAYSLIQPAKRIQRIVPTPPPHHTQPRQSMLSSPPPSQRILSPFPAHPHPTPTPLHYIQPLLNLRIHLPTPYPVLAHTCCRPFSKTVKTP